MYDIVRLQASDAQAFQSLRLDGLQFHPDAFGASYAEEAGEDLDFYINRLKQSSMFGGRLDAKLVGVAGFYSLQPQKLRHVGKLWGMYVQEAHRGTGLAEDIVAALLAHARNEVEVIQLAVGKTNLAALQFYKNCGFTEYGLEPHAIKVNGAYIDEILMYQFLN